MKKLRFFNISFESSFGGAEKQVRELLTYLEEDYKLISTASTATGVQYIIEKDEK